MLDFLTQDWFLSCVRGPYLKKQPTRSGMSENEDGQPDSTVWQKYMGTFIMVYHSARWAAESQTSDGVSEQKLGNLSKQVTPTTQRGHKPRKALRDFQNVQLTRENSPYIKLNHKVWDFVDLRSSLNAKIITTTMLRHSKKQETMTYFKEQVKFLEICSLKRERDL